MIRRNLATLIVLAAAVTVAALAGSPSQPASAAPAAQSGELLTNPGLEADANDEYPRVATSEGGGAVAAGWSPWWYNDAGADYSVPEFEVAPVTRDPYRVHSGNAAQQLFRPSVLWKAGIYQRVAVSANARVRFTIWGHAWSSFCIAPGSQPGDPIDCTHYHDSYWGQANTVHMRIGIDPTGGQDWQSPAIVWSSELNAIDIYTQFVVEAQAQGDAVTVFTYSTFDWPAPVNNVYWDDASLVVVAGGDNTNSNTSQSDTTNTTPTSAPPPPAAGPGAIATQPPDADGTQYHIVRSGETLGGIAVAYGVTTQEIRDLNGISGDLISVGQKLLIRRAAAPTPMPTATPTLQMAVEAPTPTSQQVAAVPETGQLCVALFQDINNNGQRDSEELLVAGGMVNLSGPANNSYLTDGSNEPYCFSDLPSGDYTVSVSAPNGYSLVTVPSVQTAVSGGSDILLSFGVTELSAAPENSDGQDMSDEEAVVSNAGSATRNTMLLVGGIGVVLLLASLGGLAAYFFVFRNRASIE